jgi:hypothetical protein
LKQVTNLVLFRREQVKKRTSKAKPAKTSKRSSAKRQGKKPTKAVQKRLPTNATKADRQEAAHFVETLEANKQLAREPGPLPAGATHQVERDQSGNEQIVRKRYSAF